MPHLNPMNVFSSSVTWIECKPRASAAFRQIGPSKLARRRAKSGSPAASAKVFPGFASAQPGLRAGVIFRREEALGLHAEVDLVLERRVLAFREQIRIGGHQLA